VPTIAATGLPSFEAVSNAGIFAPAKTPPAILNRLSQEVVRSLKRPELKDRIVNASIDVLGTSPEEFARYIKAEQERLGAVIKARGLRETK
jgi:tripartite-type tricarboxylate transporter receptor subunit TctC